MESKVRAWTQLTENQPQSYLASLQQQIKDRKILIFLLPDRYDHENVIIEGKKIFDAEHSDHSIGFEILRWSSFYDALKKSGLHQLNTSIAHFGEVLKNWFVTPEIKFSKEELEMIYSKEIPAIIIKLESLISAIKENIRKAYDIKDEIYSSTPGFYIKDQSGQKVLWFGLWHKFWLHRGSPVVAAVEADWKEHVIGNLKKKYKSEFESYIAEGEQEWYVYPLPKEYLSRSSVNEISGWLMNITKDLAG